LSEAGEGRGAWARRLDVRTGGRWGLDLRIRRAGGRIRTDDLLFTSHPGKATTCENGVFQCMSINSVDDRDAAQCISTAASPDWASLYFARYVSM
jgi:hypothetical protein